MVLVRRLALGLLCWLVRLVQLLVLATHLALFALAALVMVVIGLVILAFLAADEKCGRNARPERCSRSWAGVGPAMFEQPR